MRDQRSTQSMHHALADKSHYSVIQDRKKRKYYDFENIVCFYFQILAWNWKFIGAMEPHSPKMSRRKRNKYGQIFQSIGVLLPVKQSVAIEWPLLSFSVCLIGLPLAEGEDSLFPLKPPVLVMTPDREQEKDAIEESASLFHVITLLFPPLLGRSRKCAGGTKRRRKKNPSLSVRRVYFSPFRNTKNYFRALFFLLWGQGESERCRAHKVWALSPLSLSLSLSLSCSHRGILSVYPGGR